MAITWTQKTKAQAGNSGPVAINTDGSFIVEAPGTGFLYKTIDQGANWTNIRDTTYNITDGLAIDSDGSNIVAGSHTSGWNNRLRYSIDSGANWTTVSTGIDAIWYSTAISQDGTVMIAAQYQNRLWRSTNSGTNWSEMRPVDNNNYQWYEVCCDSDASVIYAHIYGGNTYVTTNSGTSWSNIPYIGGLYIYSMRCSGDGSKVIVQVLGGRTYLSSDYGANWTETYPTGTGSNNYFKVDISSDGNVLVAAAHANTGRFWFSTNGGTSWEESSIIGFNNYQWYPCLSKDGTKVWCGRVDQAYSYSYYGVIASSARTTDFFELF